MLSKSFLALTLGLVGVLLAIPSELAQAGGYGYVGPVYYAATNYYDGGYHYHNAGYGADDLWYPAGQYAWVQGQWYLQGYGFGAGIQKTVSYSPGWQGKLLDIAAARDKVEGRLREKALDYQNFTQAVNALGLKGNFTLQNYGVHPGFPGGYNASGIPLGSLGLGSYGASNQTIYGYTYNTIKDVYGDTNLNALYQQSARLSENAQSLAGQATQGHQQLAEAEGNNRARVAEVLAKAQAAKVALDAANLPPSSHEKTTGQVTVTGPAQAQAAATVQPTLTAPAAEGWRQIASQSCISCHSSATKGGPKAKLDILNDYPRMTAEQQAKVIETIFSGAMPLGEDGKPKPLSAEKKVQWTK